MKLIELLYKLRKKKIPYYAHYSLMTIIIKPIRKFLNVVIIPDIPFSLLRTFCYKLLGYKIGKNVFIGMKCYLDDMEPQNMTIEENVIISYGCYFSLHGINQNHKKIIVKKNAYIGMRSNIVSVNDDLIIGENSIIGAGSLVNRSIPDNVTAAGVPAKIIKKN